MGGKTSKTAHPPLVISRPTTPVVSEEPKDPQTKELLKYVVPTGLYKVNNWDRRLVRKAVLDKQLAPLYPGSTEKTKDDMEECPICFMYYPNGLNRSNCCKQGICTECYLQMRPHPTVNVECPFCKRPGYSAVYKGPLSKEERDREEQEQRKVQKLQEEIRLEEEKRDSQRLALAAVRPVASGDVATRSRLEDKEKKERDKGKEKEPKEPKEQKEPRESSRDKPSSASSSEIGSPVPAPAARKESELSSNRLSSDSDDAEALGSPMLLRIARQPDAPVAAASSGSHGPAPVRPSTPLPAPPRTGTRKSRSSNAGSSPVPADADEEERQLHEAIRLSLLEAAAASTYNARLPSSGNHN